MSQKGVSPLKFGVPNLPPPPYPGEVNFFRWVQALYVELELHFAKIREQLVDTRGILQVETKRVTNGFTIQPSAPYIDLISDGAVTSSEYPVLWNGVEGQAVVLTNIGNYNITVKTPATKTLSPNTAIELRWNDFNKAWVQIVTL